ncbi:energy-coupling factor transporter ATPase [Kroppenstedtia pulmonis]|uniref:Energy-coupling factor transporter ATP-binding protein EcfA2 n=1 Tax=Kroppenstedtia pulmonis TaxID=1380685 RepID=A0A7D3XT35_9BACL|nr:energy-coupling factor transporter ATPase [Kroppenstedtia pulmonis]QKG85568.1 energy-coupling factor transporter ATPase [Kroppenstedtia pulmonis]
MGIIIKGLTHQYMANTPYAKTSLSDINLSIPSGTFTGIIGPTGSGKSTLIQHIAGLLKPTKGSVQVGETIITPETKKLKSLRSQVGMVFQYPEYQLFEDTVEKDIAYGPRNQGRSEEEIRRQVGQAMDWVGLSRNLSTRSPFQLSGGQMRRVAVAGILAMMPKVLILDEPTAGLDPQGQRELLDTIYHIHKERAMTVILVSHSMEEVARYADHLVVMVHGRLALSGTPGEVFNQTEQLRKWGLEVPMAVQVIEKLNRFLSPPLSKEIFTLEALEEHLFQRWHKGGAS